MMHPSPARLGVLALILAGACEPTTTSRRDALLCDGGEAPYRWFLDADGDGFGDRDDPGTLACLPMDGRAPTRTDCNDADPDVNPDAEERCNAIDDDCFPDNDIVLGDQTVNGIVTDSVQWSLTKASGSIEIGLCGGTHELTFEAPPAVTSVSVEGTHPTERATLQIELVEPGLPSFQVPANAELTLRHLDVQGGLLTFLVDGDQPIVVEDLDLDGTLINLSTSASVTVSDVRGDGTLDVTGGIVDIRDVTASSLFIRGEGTASHLVVPAGRGNLLLRADQEGQTLQVEDVEIREGAGLTVFGEVSLRRAILDRPSLVTFIAAGAVELDEVYAVPGERTRVRLIATTARPGSIRGLVLGGVPMVDIDLQGGGELELIRPVLRNGGGLHVRSKGSLTLTGGELVGNGSGQAGAIWANGDSAGEPSMVTLRGTTLLRNAAEEPDRAVLYSEGSTTFVLEDVVVGSGGQANLGPLLRVGDATYDATGTVSLTCDRTSCEP